MTRFFKFCLLMAFLWSGARMMGAATLTQDKCQLTAWSSITAHPGGCTTGGYWFDLQKWDPRSGYVRVATSAQISDNTYVFESHGEGWYRIQVWAAVSTGNVILVNGKPCEELVDIEEFSSAIYVDDYYEWDSWVVDFEDNVDEYLAIRPKSSDNKVYYTDGNGYLWNIYFPSNGTLAAPLSWTVTNVAGPIACMPGDDPASEVFYRGKDSKMYRFYFSNGQWHSIHLNINVSNVAAGGQIAISEGKVFYRGTDGNIWNFYKNGSFWVAAALGSGDNATGPLAANEDGEVFFRASDGLIYIYQWFAGTGWLRSPVGSNANVSSSDIVAVSGKVYYRSYDDRMFNLYKPGGIWTSASLGGNSNVAGDLSISAESPTHVYYRGTDNHLWQFYYNSSGWHNVRLDPEWGNVKGPVVNKPARVYYRSDQDMVWNAWWGLCESEKRGTESTELPSYISQRGGIQIELYPNPMVDRAEIRLIAGMESTIDLAVYDLMGKEMKRIAQHREIPAGSSAFSVMVDDLAAGTYVLRLQYDGRTEVQKMVVR